MDILGTTAANDQNQQIGMTLAEIAYSKPENIGLQLAYPEYATAGQWSLRWTGYSAGNQMYVAQNSANGQWVVAIRGSATDPLSEKFWIDWFEQDLQVFDQVKAPWSNVPDDARIAWGTREGLKDLLGIVGTDTKGNHQQLTTFLAEHVNFSAAMPLAIVGHSLGGALTSVLAPYLVEEIAKPKGVPASSVVPLTFAGPTAGNQQYAAYLTNLFDGYPYRFQNSLDIVPHSWSLDGLKWISGSYQPSPQISDFFYGLVWTVREFLKRGNYDYVQPGAGEIVAGKLANYYWWFEEAGHQHSGENYLSLYGAPPVKFPPPKSQERFRFLKRD